MRLSFTLSPIFHWSPILHYENTTVGFLFANPFSDLDNPDCLHFRASRTKNLIHTVGGCYTDLRNFIASFFHFFALASSRGAIERTVPL